MKKFMVMLLMVAAVMFASPLFALDESPPWVKTFNSTAGAEMIYDKNGLGQVGAAHADDVTFVKVNVLHKDTLMYSWGEGIDTKIQMEQDGDIFQLKNVAFTTIAVVCYMCGEGGV